MCTCCHPTVPWCLFVQFYTRLLGIEVAVGDTIISLHCYLNWCLVLSKNYFGCCSCGCGWGYLLWGLVSLRPSFGSKAVVDEDILETAVGGWRRSRGDTFLERIQQKLLWMCGQHCAKGTHILANWTRKRKSEVAGWEMRRDNMGREEWPLNYCSAHCQNHCCSSPQDHRAAEKMHKKQLVHVHTCSFNMYPVHTAYDNTSSR